MSKLVVDRSTADAVLSSPSRRSLFGAGASILTGVALVTGYGLSDPAFVKPPPLPWRNGPRPPDEPDAELIRLCHAFAEAEFANWYRYVVAPVETADDDDAPPDWDTYHLIIATPATTPAGWHAKALAFVAWDREAYDDEEKARIAAEIAERQRAWKAEEAAKREAAEEPMTRERAEEMLASRARLREAAEEIDQEALDRLAAFGVAA